MVICDVMLDECAMIPTRAHVTDAGLDLYSGEDIIVPHRSSVMVHTGVHIVLPDGYCGILVSKSGLMQRHKLTTTGLIDAGYTGEIMVPVFNHGVKDVKIEKGYKISQMVVLRCEQIVMQFVREMPKTDRGEKGFGSSGV